MEKNKKGSVTLYIVFLVMGIIIVIISAFAAPMMVRFNTEMYAAGENIIRQNNDSIASIQDTDMKNTLYTMMDRSQDATAYNIQVNNALFQYGWILVIGLVAIVVFLYTRRLIEYGGAGLG